MTIGEKIKRIRVYRKMTQKELGIKVGFDEKGAENRMTQYETNYRIPKKEALLLIAKALNVNPINFISEFSGSATDIIQTLFWLEEASFGSVNLFRLVRDKDRTPNSNNIDVRYNDGDNWPAQAPIGMWFNYGTVDVFLREWLIRQEELNNGEITRDEYFEWKLNWPHTCDDEGRHEPKVQWRNAKI